MVAARVPVPFVSSTCHLHHMVTPQGAPQPALPVVLGPGTGEQGRRGDSNEVPCNVPLQDIPQTLGSMEAGGWAQK